MNVDDAAHAVVHDYPGGSESLGPRIAMSAAVLRNKVNPNNTTHHLTLREAVRISELTGDRRIVQAFAQQCGQLVLAAPGADDALASDMAVLEMVVGVGGAQGEMFGAIHHALGDGRLSQQELDGIRACGNAAMARIASLMQRLGGMVDA